MAFPCRRKRLRCGAGAGNGTLPVRGVGLWRIERANSFRTHPDPARPRRRRVLSEKDPDELLDLLQRRALAAADLDEPAELDVVGAAGRGTLGDAEASAAPDITLGGYMKRHTRPAAFEGSDGQPYTVDVDTEESEDGEGRWTAFLVFLRWADTGAGIMDHLESGDVAYGATEDEARHGALALSLYDVKAELDDAIERRRRQQEE